MPTRAPTPPSPATPRHALRGLVCLVLLGWVGKPASARIRSQPRSTPDDSSAPYLRVVGSLPLRFQALPVPPAPAASGPPLPASPVMATPAAEAPAGSPPPATTPPPETAPASVPAPPAEPPPIIPDEMRPRVQPEDFLPFFQFPGSTGAPGDVSVAAPLNLAPNPPHHGTPSTATYRQQ